VYGSQAIVVSDLKVNAGAILYGVDKVGSIFLGFALFAKLVYEHMQGSVTVFVDSIDRYAETEQPPHILAVDWCLVIDSGAMMKERVSVVVRTERIQSICKETLQHFAISTIPGGKKMDSIIALVV
jgi:hypothetical protein